MASSRPAKPKEDLSLESDEYLQHVCDLCLEDDQQLESTAFCTICQQYLCAPCHKSHGRVSATKHHTLLTGKDMPAKDEKQNLRPICKQHPDKVLEYFCKEHKIACCSSCQILNHRFCRNLLKFADVDKRRNFREEGKQNLEGMKRLLDEFSRLETVHTVQISDLQTQEDGLIQKVRDTRRRFDHHIDALEAEIISSIKKGNQHAAKELEKQISHISCIEDGLKTQITESENNLKRPSKDQTIVTAFVTESEVQKYADLIKEIHSGSNEFDITFHVSKELESFPTKLKSFGEVNMVKTNARFQRPFKDREAVHLGEVDIRTLSDKQCPEVQSVEILPNGNILIRDGANNKVKLFNSNFALQKELNLPSQPQCMAVLNPSLASVSLPEEQCIHDIIIADNSSLKLGRKYKTDKVVSELIICQDRMIVATFDAMFWYLSLMDRHGNRVRRIRKEPLSDGLFDSLIMLGLSADENILYVTDRINGCFGITLDGTIVFHYKDSAMPSYVGVCPIPDNSAFISGPESNKIVMINNSGEKIKEISVAKGFETLAYGKTSNLLFAENTLTHTLSVFTLV